ncbi:MAG: MCE family protein [Proteobacteria bacterium]|nr:MAG: MCE family protein [Pseudomonadota bacterium]
MKVASIKTRINLGVFVLCIAIVAAICIVIAGDEVSFFRKSQTYRAHFANTAGLVAGAPVRMGGVEVGRVTTIKIEPSDEGMVIAGELRVDSPYFELIRSDASVSLDTQGLLGDKFVSLNAGASNDAMPPGNLIATKELEGIGKVMEQSKAIMETVNNTTKKIDAFTENLPNSDSMKAVGNDFAEAAKSLRVLMSRISADDSIISTLNDKESKRMLKSSLASLESAAAHADSIAKKIDGGQGTLGALVNDRALYEDLRGILGHIDRGKNARRVFIEAAGSDPAAPARK